MLNRFCSLSKLPLPPTPTPLLLTNKTKLDGIPSKIKWKIHVFWYLVFKVLKLLLISHQLLHKQISFFVTFQNLIQHFLKQHFCHKISFFNRCTQVPKSLHSQNLLSVIQVFYWGSLNLENLWFYSRVAVVWLFNFMTEINDFTSPLTHNHDQSAKTTKHIPKCWEISVKREPNLSFIRVIKIYLLINVFYMYMVR